VQIKRTKSGDHHAPLKLTSNCSWSEACCCRHIARASSNTSDAIAAAAAAVRILAHHRLARRTLSSCMAALADLVRH